MILVLSTVVMLSTTGMGTAQAAAGDLDTTFGGDGKVLTDFGSDADAGTGLVIQPDGKIVVAGYRQTPLGNDFAVARYKPGGGLDPTFSGDGKVTTGFVSCGLFCIPLDDYPYDVALQPDGKIVAAGTSGGSFALVRYKPDGTLDTSFSRDGKVTTAFTSFGAAATAVLIQPDGKIVAAGQVATSQTRYDFGVARYNPNGSLDATFSGDGRQMTDFGNDTSDHAFRAALQSDGKIVVAGDTYNGNTSGLRDFALARYNPNGSLDSTFNFDGKVITDFVQSDDVGFGVAIQSDGRIVAVGATGVPNKFGLVRYTSLGSLDSSFSGDGKLSTLVDTGALATGVTFQSDGKIVVAGLAISASDDWNIAVARYKSGGALDTTFGGDGKVTTNFGTDRDLALDVAVQPSDGKIVVAGQTSIDFALARYLSS